MSADAVLWFRRPNGEVTRFECHPNLVKSYTKFYTDKGFEALPGEPGAVVIKGDLAPEPEPLPAPNPDTPEPEKRGPGRPRK